MAAGALALACAGGAFAQASPAIPLIDIPSAPEPVEAPMAHAMAQRGAFTANQVAGGALDKAFAPAPAHASPLIPLDAESEAWVALRLRNPSSATRTVTVQVRQTSVDEVVLYERVGGRWREWLAGDRIPQTQWTKPGRFARFDLALDPGQVLPVLLRVRNAAPTVLFLEVGMPGGADLSNARSSFALAASLGALALLVVASFVQAVAYRDRTYFVFSAYAALLGLALASITGTADELWWRDAATWADHAKTVLPIAAASLSVLIVKALCRVATRSRPVALAINVAAGIVMGAALVTAAAGPMLGVVAAGFLLAASTVVLVALWAWRRGDRMGLWVLAAHVPLIVTSALIVLRRAGVVALPFRANAMVGVSMAFILLLLLVALVIRSRELLSVKERNNALQSIDPLTGLLSPSVFARRVAAAAARYRRSRHDAAVLYVRVANHDAIKAAHGTTVAEQSLIRAAIKLQSVLREADTVGRVGECTFGCILETVVARAQLQERAARLVAHGLMTPPGLDPPVSLVFHVAAAAFSTSGTDSAALGAGLEAELSKMSARTRRPIRFLEDAAAPGPASDPEEREEAA